MANPPVLAVPPAVEPAVADAHDAPAHQNDLPGSPLPAAAAPVPSRTDRFVQLTLAIVILGFLLYVFFHGNIIAALSGPQTAILTLFAVIFGGLVGTYLSGALFVDGSFPVGSATITFKSVGGFAFAVLTLFLFLHDNPVKSPDQGAATVTQALTNKAATSLTSNDKGVIQTPVIDAQTKQLALKVAAADPQKYGFLGKLGASQLNTEVLGDVLNRLQGRSAPADLSRLESEMGNGYPPFLLNSSIQAVEQAAGAPAYPPSSLIKAEEYSTADVRYFTVAFAALGGPGAPALQQHFPPIGSCTNTQSYVAFLFEADRLIRMSIRFLPPCSVGLKAIEDFAASYGLKTDPKSPVIFQQSLQSTTIGAYSSNNGTTNVDFYLTAGPQPN